MDAVKFMQERKRMCATTPCAACPVYATGKICTEDDNLELLVATVEKWFAAHPRKTRQSVFLEQYPEARVTDNGDLAVCPANVSAEHRDEHGGCVLFYRPCEVCRREFWSQEVE